MVQVPEQPVVVQLVRVQGQRHFQPRLLRECEHRGWIDALGPVMEDRRLGAQRQLEIGQGDFGNLAPGPEIQVRERGQHRAGVGARKSGQDGDRQGCHEGRL